MFVCFLFGNRLFYELKTIYGDYQVEFESCWKILKMPLQLSQNKTRKNSDKNKKPQISST